MSVALKRAYEQSTAADGYRVFVDRLWPRGLSKKELKFDAWMKDVAPSTQLRKSFHDGEASWGKFRKGYLAELKSHRKELRHLVRISREGQVTLIFSAHDKEHNNAVVLLQYLRMLGADCTSPSQLDMKR